MNQLFGNCVNALTTDYEIRRNGPSPALYFSPLLDATPAYHAARPQWSAQRTRAVGRSVGGIIYNFSSYSGAQVNFGLCAFQAVGSGKCVISVSIPR